MNGLRAPERQRAGQPGKRFGFPQNGQGGVDWRRDRAAAHSQANGLREFAERDAFGGRYPADQLVNGRRVPLRKLALLRRNALKSQNNTIGNRCHQKIHLQSSFRFKKWTPLILWPKIQAQHRRERNTQQHKKIGKITG